jgi:hypothetical protein
MDGNNENFSHDKQSSDLASNPDVQNIIRSINGCSAIYKCLKEHKLPSMQSHN